LLLLLLLLLLLMFSTATYITFSYGVIHKFYFFNFLQFYFILFFVPLFSRQKVIDTRVVFH
jgi:hypothetical protein